LGVPILDEMIMLVTCLGLGAAVFSFRRWKEVLADAHERQMAEAALRVSRGDLEQRVQELFTADAALQAKIVEHKRAAASLIQSEEFNRCLVTASPIGILLLDAEFTITYDNPALRRLMGVPQSSSVQITGQKLLDVPAVKTAVSAAAAQALLAGEPIIGETIHYRTQTGLEIDMEANGALLHDTPAYTAGAGRQNGRA
jgi:PAS domain S-box-containing protein